MLIIGFLAGVHGSDPAHTEDKITMKHLVRPDDQRLE